MLRCDPKRQWSILLAIVSFGVGAGVTGFWLHQLHKGAAVPTGNPAEPDHVVLSDTTENVLHRLSSPIELRFYCLLDPTTSSSSLTGFIGRVTQLVSEYERQAGGKIKVTRFDDPSYANRNSAVADGIKAFNTEKGDPCFLGITVAANRQKESLPLLSPEWEQALEPDLTRAISRLIDAAQPPPVPATISEVESNAAEEIKVLIPNPSTVSVEEGTRILREASLKEFQAAAKEAEARVKEAQQNLVAAQDGNSRPEMEAARKQLQQAQAEQLEKLKQIAAKSQAQIQAFQQLKSAGK